MQQPIDKKNRTELESKLEKESIKNNNDDNAHNFMFTPVQALTECIVSVKEASVCHCQEPERRGSMEI